MGLCDELHWQLEVWVHRICSYTEPEETPTFVTPPNSRSSFGVNIPECIQRDTSLSRTLCSPISGLEHRGAVSQVLGVAVFAGGGAEAGREGHSCHQRQPHRVHPPGGRLPAEQADPPALPGLPPGAGQRGQPRVASHVWPAGNTGTSA